jgi:SPP1 family predicted phage head-tail adaptor
MKCGEWRAKAKHRVVIQEMTNTSDDYGGFTTAWTTQSTVWAVIEPLSGNEVFRQDALQSKVKTKITIRYQSGLKNTATTADLRVSYDGRIFPIEYITNLKNDLKNEGTDYQVLYCRENEASEQ